MSDVARPDHFAVLEDGLARRDRPNRKLVAEIDRLKHFNFENAFSANDANPRAGGNVRQGDGHAVDGLHHYHFVRLLHVGPRRCTH